MNPGAHGASVSAIVWDARRCPRRNAKKMSEALSKITASAPRPITRFPLRGHVSMQLVVGFGADNSYAEPQKADPINAYRTHAPFGQNVRQSLSMPQL
jgi:hypothetical protein